MAKAGKLTKLRSALIKKMNTFGSNKLRRESITKCTPSPSDECHVSASQLHTVYVGKSLRRYQISSEVLDNHVIQELIVRSDGCDDDETTVIGCEVVLFEHLLWVLQNCGSKSESLDDLVAFYAY